MGRESCSQHAAATVHRWISEFLLVWQKQSVHIEWPRTAPRKGKAPWTFCFAFLSDTPSLNLFAAVPGRQFVLSITLWVDNVWAFLSKQRVIPILDLLCSPSASVTEHFVLYVAAWKICLRALAHLLKPATLVIKSWRSRYSKLYYTPSQP